MAVPFVVLFVPGVTPGKWSRAWAERMPRQPLELRMTSGAEALAALRDGSAQMAFLRDVVAGDASAGVDLHVIPLYREQPVAVASRESAIAAADALTLAELATSGEDPVAADADDAAGGAMAVEIAAAGSGYVLLPQSVARLHARKDVIARAVTDAPDTGIGLAWPAASVHPYNDVFVGIVRGRTPNSTRS